MNKEILYLLELIGCGYEFPIKTKFGSFDSEKEIIDECQRRIKRAQAMESRLVFNTISTSGVLNESGIVMS